MGKRDSGDRWQEKNDFPLDRTSDSWRRGVAGAVDGGTGRYTSNARVVRSKPSDTVRGEPWGTSKDIFDTVCKNSLDDDAGGSRPGPIKYGVD
jgi:hypothetical protein